MVTTIVIIVVPTLATAAFSLTDWSGFGEASFIGLENFRQLARDAGFLQSLKHAVIWTAIFLTVPIFMGRSVRSCSASPGLSRLFSSWCTSSRSRWRA